MNSSKFFFYGLFTVSLFWIACTDNSTLFEENKTIQDANWDAEKVFKFETEIPDTSNGYNVYLNLRNAGNYPYSNVFLFVNTYFPNGTIDKDTVEIMLASPEGKWMGRGLGDIWDNRILFKRNVTFPAKGKYRFEISQAMRLNPLPGITDAGMRIEKVN